MDASDLKIGDRYNFKYQPERLIYIGTYGPWHQFVKVERPSSVWSEILESDLKMIEETIED